MALGEELSVKVSAATTDFTASMERVEDKLEEVADESNQTSRSFGRLATSTSGLAASMGVLSTALTATAIPAFFTLSTILAPLTVVIGGLAAVAASLGAVFGGLALAGVVTHTSELKTAFAEAKTQIIEIIEPLGQVFGPLLVDAVETLPALVQRIVDSLGPLDQFRAAMVEMGEAAFEIIPNITEVMFNLAEEALPFLNQALVALESQGSGVFRTLSDVFRQTFPLVVQFGSAVASLLPNILELGTTVAGIVVPALTKMVNIVTQVTEKINALRPGMKGIVVSTVALAPALTSIASILAGLSAPVLAVVAALGALGAAYSENLLGFRDAVNSLVPSLGELQTGAQEAFAGMQQFLSPLDDSATNLTNSLMNMGRTIITSLQPSIDSLGRTITSIRRPLQRIARAFRGILGGAMNYISEIVIPAYAFAFEKVVAPILNTITKNLSENLGPVLDEVAETLNALAGYAKTAGDVLKSVWKTIDSVVVPIIEGLVEIIDIVLEGAIENLASAMKAVMNLVQGDFGDAMKNLKNILSTAIDTAVDIVGVVADGLEALGKKGIKFISDAIGDFPSLLMDAFGIVGGIVDAVASAFLSLAKKGTKWITDKIGGFLTGLGNVVADTIETAVISALQAINPVNYIDGDGEEIVPRFGPGGSGPVSTGPGGSGPVSTGPVDAVPGIPSEINVPLFEDVPGLPELDTGGMVEESGLAEIHTGERVVPAAQVGDRGTVQASVDGDALEPVVDELRAVRQAVETEMDVEIEMRESPSARYDSF